MKLTAILADDEPLALERLGALLEEDPALEILTRCSDGLQAQDALRALRPDVLFLDIQMPELDGFEVLSALEPGELPVVVFVTAYDQFAIKAFEASASDYLLKPVARQRLQATLARVREALEDRRARSRVARMEALLREVEPPSAERFVVRQEGRSKVVLARDVEAVEAEANYMWIHQGQEAHPVRGTLAGLERRLQGAGFLRTHRSWLVNLAHVREILEGEAQTVSGLKVPVSSGHRRNLEEALAQGRIR
jgi:two-component system LytT family response regulator